MIQHTLQSDSFRPLRNSSLGKAKPSQPVSDKFKQQLHNVLLQETRNSRTITVAKNSPIYNCGDRDDMIYFIESNQVKLLTLSPDGKECIIGIRTTGDIFGELCLSGLGERIETAIAMEETCLKQISCTKFLMSLSCNSLLEGFIQYLAVCIAEQQKAITNLLTVDSEMLLGKTLLHLARTLGKRDLSNLLIEVKITHEELSEMIGTTRPRTSLFMRRFRQLGLIEVNKGQLIIKEAALIDYLGHIV